MNKKANIYLIAVVTLIIDQITKMIVYSTMTLNSSINVIKNFFSITYIRNNGAAWGMFGGNILFLVAATILFLFIISKWILKEKNMSILSIVSLGLLHGGILGNLIDRIFRGSVIDFFFFKIFSYDFPIFNMADIFIVVSVFVLMFELIRSEYNDRRSKRK